MKRAGIKTCLFALVGLWLTVSPAHAAPDPNWITLFTKTDCAGAAQQQTAACESYATDLYEHIDYSFTNPGTADVQVLNSGIDSDYYYTEFDFVSDYDPAISTGHQVGIEIDVDADTEANRADYYFAIFEKIEFNSTAWIDAYNQGGYNSYRDANNDVGGGDPLASDQGGSEGDGYETDVNQGPDMVWARVVNGNFQVAIKRSVVGNPSMAYLRSWSRQSTSLSKDKLYWHDHNTPSDTQQIDNLTGVGTTDWAKAGGNPDIVVIKTSLTTYDPYNLSSNPKAIPGAWVLYTIQATNQGLGPVDNDTTVVTDPIPANAEMFVNDLGGAGSGPVLFIDGATASGLSYTFTSLASTTDDVGFSNDGGATFTYTPIPDVDGFDSNVTHVRGSPKGVFNASDGVNHPSFELRFRVRVK